MSKPMYSYEEFKQIVDDFNEEQEPGRFSRGLPTILYTSADGRIAKNSVVLTLYLGSFPLWRSNVLDYYTAVDYVQLITILLSVH